MKIYSKLLLAFLPASLIAITTSGYLLYSSEKAELTQLAINHLESVASIQKSRVENLIAHNRERLSLITSQVQLRQSLAMFLNENQPNEQQKMNQILAEAKASIDSYKIITLISPEGRVVASTDSTIIGTNHTKKNMLLNNPDLRGLSHFSFDENSKLEVSLKSPLYLHGKLIGLVVVTSDASNIIALLGDASGLGKTVESYIVANNGAGDALVLTPLRFDTDSTPQHIVSANMKNTPAILALSGNETVITEATNYRGHAILSVTKYIKQLGWGLVVEIDRSEAFEPIENLKLFLLSVLLFTVFFIILISMFLSRMITKPIIALTQAVAESDTGSGIPRKVSIYANDELGILSQAFNRMAGRLVKVNQSLEEKVKELNIEIEERHKVEQQFVQAQRMEALGTLVGGLAHDFNNILAGITANAYLIKNRTTDENVLRHIESVEKLSARAADLIQKMLAFARKGHVVKSCFPASYFLRDTINLAQVGMPEHVIECVIEQEDIVICCDTTQMQQVILNLINNARDALINVEQARIEVTMNVYESDHNFKSRNPDLQSATFAKISIHDNGHGMPSDMMAKIFEPFFTTKGVGKGTGLGLAMAYGCVTRFGGVIEVESKENIGTTFHLYIPLGNEQQVSSTEAYVEVEPDLNGLTILIADDETILREAMSDAMSQFGCCVLQAEDGLGAIRVFQEAAQTIHAAVLDIAMPNVDGFKVAQQLREEKPNLPIIFITGYEKKISTAFLEMPNMKILNKPFKVETLGHAIFELTLQMDKVDNDKSN